MKSVYSALKEPFTHYLKKDILKEGTKELNVLTQKIKSVEIEDNVNISSSKELDERQIFAYKPSIMQQKINDDFNYTNRFKLNDSNKFGITKVGLNNVLYRQFKTKVDRMIKFADPTNDVAFKKIFSEDNIEGVKDFVETVISNAKDFPFSTKFKTIEFLNKDHMPSVFQGKRSLCDLKVKDDKGNTYIIEMQKRNEQDYLQRIQYYSAHAITDQLEQGIDHTEINPVITISIMSRKCFDASVPCISYHPFKETVTNKQFLDSQSHVFIELPKLEQSGLKGSTLEWLQMFKHAQKLEDIPNVQNTYVEKAYHRLEQHNWTSEEKQAYIDAKIADDMEKNNIKHAEIIGGDKARIEMAKKMLIRQKPMEEIIEFTGLSKEQIDNIK